MKVFVVGSTGRVATSLLAKLVVAGHTVVAGARRPERVIELAGIEPLAFDLQASVSEMAEQISGCDSLIFVAGSRGRDLLQTDSFGAVKTMQAAKKAGIKRYIMLSSLFALEPEKWTHPAFDSLKDYYIAKFFADNYLISNTDLDYTILQPGSLTEEPETGQVAVIEDGFGAITIGDVAASLVACLNEDKTIGKVIKVIAGTEPITRALADL